MKRIISIMAIAVAFAFTLVSCNSDDNKTTTTQDKKVTEASDLAKDEMYTCTMHNEVMSNKPGTCPKCNMKLEKQIMTAAQEKVMKEGTSVKSKEEQ
jgi:Cu(I)/Ag(I) efflux system membrane fusion protein